jgi:SAM-dependent methyltransferase
MRGEPGHWRPRLSSASVIALPVELTLRQRWRQFVEGPQRTDFSPGASVLDLGCGRGKLPGALGIDRRANTDADIVHDLDDIPYPFQDDSFDAVVVRHVLEHLDSPLDVLVEVHRITRAGGTVTIVTPYFSSHTSWADPTHRHHFTSRSFDYLIQGTDYDFYTDVRFEVVERRITLGMNRGLGERPVPVLRLLGIERLVNRFVDTYERWWAFALPLGAKDLVLRLRVVK